MQNASCAALKLKVPAALAVAFLALASASAAHAAFPGENGKIAFTSNRDGNNEIYVVNPDGSGETRLTADPAYDSYPDWSPDGKLIAFGSSRSSPAGVYVMNADGSDVRRITSGYAPSWSPDGQKIAFNRAEPARPYLDDLLVMNADGSGEVNLTTDGSTDCYARPEWSPDGQEILFEIWTLCEPAFVGFGIVKTDGTGFRRIPNVGGEESFPDWSPDGGLIAFASYGNDGEPPSGIYTVRPDGSGKATVFYDSSSDNLAPAWSPDGRRLAWARCCGGSGSDYEIVVNRGPGLTTLTSNSAIDYAPDWQPILRGYPRPAGATPLNVSLSIAYARCDTAAANRDHAGPLTGRSCNPADRASDYLTVGTFITNGFPSFFVGNVRTTVVCRPPAPGPYPPCADAGDQVDIELKANLTDVRTDDAAKSDYTGELEVRTALRITDKQNTPAPPAGTSGTVSDLSFAFTLACTPTPDPDANDVGSTCSVLTYADALVPGTVAEGKRSNWELSPIEVYDGGADGVVSTPGNTLFAKQGVFVP